MRKKKQKKKRKKKKTRSRRKLKKTRSRRKLKKTQSRKKSKKIQKTKTLKTEELIFKVSKKWSNNAYVDKAKYEKEMQTMIDWKSRMKEINPVFIKFFQDNPEFKKWFTYEAATGDMKFKPDNISN